MHLSRTTRLAAACAAALLLAGCGSQASSGAGASSSPSSQKTHTMADGTKMTDAQMKQMGSGKAGGSADPEKTSAPGQVTHRTAGPSQPAGMICSLEIARAVKRVYALPQVPSATDAWSAAAHLYTCTYRLPTGALRLSVKDLDAGAAGTAYFTALQKRLPGATRIAGLQNLGFPAFQTGGSTGSVGFLKDGKTLWVDASRATPSDLPPGFSRTATAYAVAAAILACWTD